MRTRLFVLSLLLSCLVLRAGASHYRGGEITCRALGNNEYEVTFRIYSDCHHGDQAAISQDVPIYFAVFNAAGARILTDNETSGEFVKMPVNAVSGCYNDTNEYCGKYVVAKKRITLPPSLDGYTIVNQRCCMGSDVDNIREPGVNGLTMYCRIPGVRQAGSGADDNSPQFNTPGPLRLCIRGSYAADFSATDPDGDSLAYRFISGLQGGTASDAKPIPNNIAFAPLAYAPGFSYTQPLGGSGSMSLNSATGVLSGNCSKAGEYLVAVACDEYRAGTLLGTTTREYVLEFADCGKSVTAQIQRDSAAIKAGIDTLSIVRCGGARIVRFQNTSVGAAGFYWDFGVAGTDDDTSSLRNPQFTYPAAGKYPLTLVAYGPNCADTLHGAVWLSDDELNPDFTITGGSCLLDTVVLRDNSTSTGGAITQYLWRAGSETASGTAIGLILQNGGIITISHSIFSEHGCVAAIDKQINVRTAPIYGGGDTIVPQDMPLILEASGGVSYNWEALAPAVLINYVPGSATASPQTTVLGKDFIYIVTGRDAQGCGGRDTVHLTVSERSYVFVPTVFSPNGDGLNDLLRGYVSGGNITLFSIYNRRGNLVFSTTNPREGWDGRHKGQEAAADVYFWMMKVQSGYSGHELVFGGDVTLVR